jgi:hypothetical protein
MDKGPISKQNKPFLTIQQNTKQGVNERESEAKRTGKWTKEEDDVLVAAVEKFGTKNWKAVSKVVFGRNQVQCLHRWTKILQPGLTKGPWSIAEDRKLLEWVQKEGPNKWTACAEYIKGRSGKQCRERWLNTLNPGVKKGNWEPEEDFKIFHLFKQFGSQWSKINLHFERRTENSIKNRFYSTLRRIAAEKRKESSTDSTCEMSSGSSKTKLDSLLKYVDDAYMEKQLKLVKKNGNQISQLSQLNLNQINNQINHQINHQMNHQMILNNNNFDNRIDYANSVNVIIGNEPESLHENVFSDKLLLTEEGVKVEDETMHDANTHIIPNNSNTHNYHSEEAEADDNLFPEENICFLDNEINNFLDNFFEYKNEKNCMSFLHEKSDEIDRDSNLNVNTVNIHGNNLNSVVQQLNSLEELLQNTKKQILSGSAFSEPQRVFSK